MKILVVGDGSIGRRHMRNLQTLPHIQVMACSSHLRAAPLSGSENFSSLDEAFDRQPDAVVVANRTSEHLPVALAAASRGCHLLIEKPLSHTLQDIDALKTMRDHRRLTVMVGCNMRFHPALRAIREALDEKLLGDVLSVQVHCGSYLPDWRPGRDYRSCYSAQRAQGGGVLLDLVHELDYAHWLFGDVQAVSAFLGKRSDLVIDTEDVADLLLQFHSGLVAQVHLDYVQRTPSRGCRVVGSDGTVIWSDEQGHVQLLRPGEPERVLWKRPADYDRNLMYLEEMHHFVRCVEERVPPLIGLDDGEAALRIVLAAKASSAEGKVVRVQDVSRS